MPIKAACAEIGLSPRVFYNWKRRAESAEDGIYKEFWDRVVVHRKTGTTAKPVAPSDDWRSVEHFSAWVKGETGSKPLILDSGEVWEPEPWQLAAVADVLAGKFQAVWLVVPEGNGKTTMTAALVLYLLEHQLTPEIPIGSATTTQAETLFRQIEGFIIRSGKIADFNLAPGIRRIDCRLTAGHTRVYPHNEKSGDGVIPSAAVLDEGHLHPDLRLYRIWKGKYRKRGGTVFLISTAGEPSSEFEELRARLINQATEKTDAGAYVRAVSGTTVIHDWAVRDREKVGDMQIVAAANPLGSINADELEEKHGEPEMTPEHWLRRTCNIASRISGEGVTPDEWDPLFEENVVPDRTAWSIGWLDLGWKIDCTAMGVLVWESDTRRVIGGVRVLEPPVQEEDIVTGMVMIQREFSPVGWVFDPNAGGQQMVQLLDRGEHPDQEEVSFDFLEHSQDNTPMSLAARRFDDAVRNGWFVHDGGTHLRAHVLNAVRKPLGGEKYRYDRPADAKSGARRKKFPIDALTGLLMGNSMAVTEHESSKEPIAIWGTSR